MDNESLFKKITTAIQSVNRTLDADSIFLLKKNNSASEILFPHVLKDGAKPLPADKIDLSGIKIDKNGFAAISVAAESGQVYCALIPVPWNDGGFIVIQKASDFSTAASDILTILSHTIKLAPSPAAGDNADAEKFKNELIRIREMQARLFPKFNAVKGFDIAAVFLPADLMSGNFVDGFFIDETLYQITACIVSGYDAASSFAGAAIRTLVRSEGSRKIVPSLLIETIMTKMKNITSGIHAIIYLSIYQINTNNGKIVMSSYGDPTSIFYNSKKKGYMNLMNTEVGKLLAKRNFFRDISLVLEPGDIMLYYSNGAVNASTEDGSMQYGESHLVEELLKLRDDTSLETVHGLSQSIFEFSNYKPNPEDILLISMRRAV